MRRQACAILGVAENASAEEVKAAYKALVKIYHPDTGNGNPEYYNNIVQAYDYLKTHPFQVTTNYGKVIGRPSQSANSTFAYTKARDYAQFEKQYKRKKEERLSEMAEKARDEREKQERYDKAMEAINAIRIAEAIKTLIQEDQ